MSLSAKTDGVFTRVGSVVMGICSEGVLSVVRNHVNVPSAKDTSVVSALRVERPHQMLVHQMEQEWFQVDNNCRTGLPSEPGVYRFRVPMEFNPDCKMEFFALNRWIKHGVHQILCPSFAAFIDDELIGMPEGTEWRHLDPGDPSTLRDNEFPVVPEMSCGISPCPFCKTIPTIHGMKISNDVGDKYHTNHPFRFNRFWFTCCDWISPTPRLSIQLLIQGWGIR